MALGDTLQGTNFFLPKVAGRALFSWEWHSRTPDLTFVAEERQIMAKRGTKSRSAGSVKHSAGEVVKKTLKKVGKKPEIGVTVTTQPQMRLKPGKMVYYFGKLRTEGDGSMKVLLGGKGANLAEMTSIGLPVPPGFTITTDTCGMYYKAGQRLPHGLMNEVHKNIAQLE
jgi:hypothetical protein